MGESHPADRLLEPVTWLELGVAYMVIAAAIAGMAAGVLGPAWLIVTPGLLLIVFIVERTTRRTLSQDGRPASSPRTSGGIRSLTDIADQLTSPEHDALVLLGRGLSVDEIAAQLGSTRAAVDRDLELIRSLTGHASLLELREAATARLVAASHA